MNKTNLHAGLHAIGEKESAHGTPYFPFQAYSQEDSGGQFFAPYHWHDEVEFLYVESGTLQLKTEHDTHLLRAGHVYFINPGTLHGIFGDSMLSHHYALVFNLELLSFSQYDTCQNSFLNPLLSGNLSFPDGEDLSARVSGEIGRLIRKAALLYQENDLQAGTTSLSIKIVLLQILEILFRERSMVTRKKEERQDEFPLKPVFSYIEANYSERITLADLSFVIHMNKNYFCKFFKEKTGKTPFVYLNEYRINQAAAQLLMSDAPITEIALNTGFDNMSYFIRQFKHYKGCTPSAFRSMEHPKALPII